MIGYSNVYATVWYRTADGRNGWSNDCLGAVMPGRASWRWALRALKFKTRFVRRNWFRIEVWSEFRDYNTTRITPLAFVERTPRNQA